MKSLQEFKSVVEEEKQDFSKFDALVRAGLGNKAQIQRMHQILAKMEEERPNFSQADRSIIQNIFMKMVDLITNNPQIHRQARKSVKESVVDTSDFKLSASGKKVRAHRIKFDDAEEVKEEIILDESIAKDPPFILILKRKAIRLYPNGMKVAVYHNDRLDKDFAIPFTQDDAGMIQAEQIELDTGDVVELDEETLEAFQAVYLSLTEENQEKFVDLIHTSPETFEQAREFALSKVQ
jgi:transcription antitermination factor NusG